MSENFESNVANGVLHLVFTSEDGLNTMDDRWLQSLEAILRHSIDDRAVRAILLSARGSAFCAGANFLGMRTSVLNQYFTGSPLANLIDCLANFPKPIVAAVHGKAIGGGATLLLHCDLVVAAADAQFRLPFTSLGAVPELASSYLLPRAAGSKLANELLLLGKLFDAHKAQRAGFVNEVVPAGEQLALARQWAEQLAALAPTSVQTSKRLLREAQQEGLAKAIASEGAALVASLNHGELQEAVAAFLEKRRPDFSKFH
ncbi:enoyl-CoA hydratase/isomerase family protein [Pseudomonas arsenicoxydans]|uniref:Enoyl-CoA hydratase n=1 Tax=Pseudomonas arsenicoxydans TaxID=702115 RepID=A0A502HRW4_9PSED|nr:enoyl-CoA hydratase-related protein [Pseudomonas arsenicoxydans]TPG76404.1 enoyl-CoA hydratase [Pseudomonas arsenicoxydans]